MVNWPHLLAQRARAPAQVVVHTIIKSVQTYSRPSLVLDEDRKQYWIKCLRNDQQNRPSGKAIFFDQVAGRLSRLLDGPTPWVGLAEIPIDLTTANPGDPLPGLCHAISDIPGAGARDDGFRNVDFNKERYASLSLLYGIIGHGDRQFLFDVDQRVWAVDFGHCLDPNWTTQSFANFNRPLLVDDFMQFANLTINDLALAVAKLKAITPDIIADVVSAPPDSWGVDTTHREAFADFLWARAQGLAQLIDDRLANAA